MTRSTTKSFISLRAIWASALSKPASELGTLVCWDQWYPEGARLTALQGAHVLFLSHRDRLASGRESRVRHGPARCLAHHSARARDRQRSLRGGGEPRRLRNGNIRGKSAPGQGLEFWGGSFFCDPFGRVLAEASHDREEILIGEVDLKALEDIRRNWPFLRDRRIDSYAPITSRLLD